jgi:hypothetical protein
MRLEDTRNSINGGNLTELRLARNEGCARQMKDGGAAATQHSIIDG